MDTVTSSGFQKIDKNINENEFAESKIFEISSVSPIIIKNKIESDTSTELFGTPLFTPTLVKLTDSIVQKELGFSEPKKAKNEQLVGYDHGESALDNTNQKFISKSFQQSPVDFPKVFRSNKPFLNIMNEDVKVEPEDPLGVIASHDDNNSSLYNSNHLKSTSFQMNLHAIETNTTTSMVEPSNKPLLDLKTDSRKKSGSSSSLMSRRLKNSSGSKKSMHIETRKVLFCFLNNQTQLGKDNIVEENRHKYQFYMVQRPEIWQKKALLTLINSIKDIKKFNQTCSLLNITSACVLSILLEYNKKKKHKFILSDVSTPHLWFDWESITEKDTRFKSGQPIRDRKNRDYLIEHCRTNMSIGCISSFNCFVPEKYKKINDGCFLTAVNGQFISNNRKNRILFIWVYLEYHLDKTRTVTIEKLRNL